VPVRVENLIAANKNRHHPHNERLLPSPPGRVEHRRGGGRAGSIRPGHREAPGDGPLGPKSAAFVSARAAGGRCPTVLADRRAGLVPGFRRSPEAGDGRRIRRQQWCPGVSPGTDRGSRRAGLVDEACGRTGKDRPEWA
jgi:hypothetical protein